MKNEILFENKTQTLNTFPLKIFTTAFSKCHAIIVLFWKKILKRSSCSLKTQIDQSN